MNPLWVDARDYIESHGQKVTTENLNEAMNLLASNPQLRKSGAMARGGATGIAAGLGAPLDQIAQTPLAPPSTTRNSPSGGGKHGASSGNRTAGGTSASGKTVKDVPAGVGNYAAAGGQDNANAQGVTTPTNYTPATSSSSPVGTVQAGTGADDPGFLAHLMGGDYNGRIAAGAGGLAAILGALVMGRGGAGGGARPRAGGDPLAGAAPYGTPNVMADPSAMPMSPYGSTGVFTDPLEGAAPYGTPGAFTPPPDPLANVAPYGTPAVMDPRAPNQSPVPYSGEAPQSMPPQLAAIIEDAIHGAPMRNPIGTRRGTQRPYSGEVPAGAQSGIPDPIMQLLLNKTDNSTMGGSR